MKSRACKCFFILGLCLGFGLGLFLTLIIRFGTNPQNDSPWRVLSGKYSEKFFLVHFYYFKMGPKLTLCEFWHLFSVFRISRRRQSFRAWLTARWNAGDQRYNFYLGTLASFRFNKKLWANIWKKLGFFDRVFWQRSAFLIM